MTEEGVAKILIVDDDKIIKAILTQLISKFANKDDFLIVDDFEDALVAARNNKIEILYVDGLVTNEGIGATKEFLSKLDGYICKKVAMSNTPWINQELVRNGCDTYIEKANLIHEIKTLESKLEWAAL